MRVSVCVCVCVWADVSFCAYVWVPKCTLWFRKEQARLLPSWKVCHGYQVDAEAWNTWTQIPTAGWLMKSLIMFFHASRKRLTRCLVQLQQRWHKEGLLWSINLYVGGKCYNKVSVDESTEESEWSPLSHDLSNSFIMLTSPFFPCRSLEGLGLYLPLSLPTHLTRWQQMTLWSCKFIARGLRQIHRVA